MVDLYSTPMRKLPRNLYRAPTRHQQGVGGVNDLVVETLLPMYEREMRQFKPKFAAYGRKLAGSMVQRLQGVSPLLVVDPNFKPPPPSPPFGPSWLPRVTDPIVTAVSDGFKAEISPYTEKLTKKLAVRAAAVTIPVVALIFFGGFFLGRHFGARSAQRDKK